MWNQTNSIIITHGISYNKKVHCIIQTYVQSSMYQPHKCRESHIVSTSILDIKDHLYIND